MQPQARLALVQQNALHAAVVGGARGTIGMLCKHICCLCAWPNPKLILGFGWTFRIAAGSKRNSGNQKKHLQVAVDVAVLVQVSQRLQHRLHDRCDDMLVQSLHGDRRNPA